MRKLYTLVVLLIPIISSAQTLIGSWPFNGNANDVSGNNLNGTIFGAVPTAGVGGVANTAYLFDGASSHIDVPYSAILNLTTWTIQATVRIDSFNPNTCQAEQIVSRGTVFSNDIFDLQINDETYDGDCNVFSPTFTEFVPAAAGSPSISYHLGHFITPHVWNCYVATYDGSFLKTYINGALADSETWASQYAYGSTQPILSFGYYPYGGAGFPYYLNGAIDNISIWSGVLPVATIANLCTPNADVKIVAGIVSDIKLFPNPNNGAFTVSGDIQGSEAELEVINAVGQIILKKNAKISNGYLNEAISTNNMSAGVYYVKINGLQTKVIKFVIN